MNSEKSETVDQAEATPEPAVRGGQVVGVDGSEGSGHALEWAVNHIPVFGGVQPIVAWQYPWWGMGTGLAADPLPPPPEDFAAAARATADRALESYARPGVSPAIVCRSNAGPALVEFGAGADLVVVGTRGHGAIAGAVLGSISSHVVGHSRRPVAVIPIDAPTDCIAERTDAKIVVGLDGSENSIAALAWAIKTLPATVSILAVHSYTINVGAAPELVTLPIEAFETQAQATLDFSIEKALSLAGVTAPANLETKLAFGDPRSILRDHAEDASMLVLGARGHRGIAHLLLGSVTTGLVHHPNTVTIVVPATGEDGTPDNAVQP